MTENENTQTTDTSCPLTSCSIKLELVQVDDEYVCRIKIPSFKPKSKNGGDSWQYIGDNQDEICYKISEHIKSILREHHDLIPKHKASSHL